MTFYVLVHNDAFLDSQVASISRHHPDARIVFVISGNANGVFGDNVILCPFTSTFTMARWLIPRLPDEPAAIMEWDMILTRPVDVRDACNREPDPAVDTYHPAFISFVSPHNLNDTYLVSQISQPFTGAFATVCQSWVVGGCEERSFFRTLDNGIVHYHHRAAFKTKDTMSSSRIACWNALMERHGLPLMRKDSRPGLGDRVASALSAVGITKERVEAVLGGPCGCDQRQEALNDLGRKIGLG